MASKCNLIVDSCCDFTAAQVEKAGLVCLPISQTEASMAKTISFKAAGFMSFTRQFRKAQPH